jgi:hypothetical protein
MRIRSRTAGGCAARESSAPDLLRRDNVKHHRTGCRSSVIIGRTALRHRRVFAPPAEFVQCVRDRVRMVGDHRARAARWWSTVHRQNLGEDRCFAHTHVHDRARRRRERNRNPRFTVRTSPAVPSAASVRSRHSQTWAAALFNWHRVGLARADRCRDGGMRRRRSAGECATSDEPVAGTGEEETQHLAEAEVLFGLSSDSMRWTWASGLGVSRSIQG